MTDRTNEEIVDDMVADIIAKTDERTHGDIVHAADTGQIPLMGINEWTKLGLVTDSGRPSNLCKRVADALESQ